MLQCIFYVCRVSRRRQEQAATSGVIPYLQRCFVEGSPLKQFALPILCDLAHTSHHAREQLKRNAGCLFYVRLLREPFWQISALNSLAVWLKEDPSWVERQLLEGDNVGRLVLLFCTVEERNFENVLESLLEMMTRSSLLSEALGADPEFLHGIAGRLRSPRAIVRKGLLQMLRIVLRQNLDPKRVLQDFKLKPILLELSRDDAHVLVMDLASQLLTHVDGDGDGFTARWP